VDIPELVALALFVLPGILAEKISYKMDFPSAEKRTDFAEVVNGMLLSLPILLVATMVTISINNFKTLESLVNTFVMLVFFSSHS
jgi:hypothetical protein